MLMKQITLSVKAKENLSRLKARTGIQNWNVLCRWAFCYSLSEHTIPLDLPIQANSNVEMSWQTFGGEYADVYEALIKYWCQLHDLPLDPETVSKYFRLHLERGISHLSGTGLITSLDDLLDKAMGDETNGSLS